MRRMLVAAFILGCIAEGAFLWVVFARSMVHADSDLTALVEAAFLSRTEDPGLHALAHERAQYQVTFSGGVCGEGSLTHEGLTTAEVLACNYEGPEKTVQQWLGSPDHAAILLDPNLALIGCGSAPGDDGATFYACVLTAGVSVTTAPTPAPIIPAPPAEVPAATPEASVPQSPVAPVLLLPDTRMR